MTRKSSLKADTLLQSISVGMALAVVTHALSFGRGILFARALGPAELGLWALAITAIQVVAFILLLGIPNGLGRYVERLRQAGTLREFLRVACATVLSCLLVAVLVGFALGDRLTYLFFGANATPGLTTLTLAAIAATVVSRLVRGILQGLRLLRVDCWLELVFDLGFLVLAIALYRLWGPSASANAAALFGITLVTGVAAAAIVIRALKSSELDKSAASTKAPMLRLGGLMLFSIGIWSADSLESLSRTLDRYMLLHLSAAEATQTLENLGDYFLAGRLAKPLSMLAGMVGMMLLPHAAHLWESGKRSAATDMIVLTTKLLGLAMTFAGACVLLLHRPLFLLLFGRVPSLGPLIIAPVMVITIMAALSFVVRSDLLCRERVWRIAGLWLVALAGNVVLNAVLIPPLGLYGAVMATLISTALATGGLLACSQLAAGDFHRSVWITSAAPLMLLAPPAVLACLFALLSAVLLYTDWVFAADEKDSINCWLSRRFSRQVAVGQSSSECV